AEHPRRRGRRADDRDREQRRPAGAAAGRGQPRLSRIHRPEPQVTTCHLRFRGRWIWDAAFSGGSCSIGSATLAVSPGQRRQRAVRDWEALADGVLGGEELTRAEAISILASDDEQLLPLFHAAFRIRRAHFGLKVKLNMLVNAKSGICPEDCGYCSQSIVSTADVPKYQLLSRDVLLDGAREAWARKAGTYCIVASGRR